MSERRAIDEERWQDIQPLSHLSHPILVKSREVTETTSHHRTIGCSGDLRLAEIRSSQWRAGVWTDPRGIHWVLAAGLAKGDHEDHKDFYQTLERQCAWASGRDGLKPTRLDKKLLLSETIARASTEWELQVQEQIGDLIEVALAGQPARHAFFAPVLQPDASSSPTVLAEVELTISADHGVENIDVTYIRRTSRGTIWDQRLEYRLLVTSAPPTQGWDTAFEMYSAMEEPGHCSRRVQTVRDLTRNGVLTCAEPSSVAHRVHRPHIGDAAVNGTAMRALCGAFFIPQTDPEDLPACPECSERWNTLPVVKP